MSEQILEQLWQLHNDPTRANVADLSGEGLSVDAGQALQVQLLQRFIAAGEAIGGWKLGMTSGASRDAMGPGVRPFGFVRASRVLPSGAALPVAEMGNGGVENELCLIVGRALGAEATPEQARAAVAGIAPAFEINQKRLAAGASPGLRVADDLSNWGIVVGSMVAPRELGDLTVTLFGDDAELGQVASKGHIDDHYQSLATLARRLGQFGLALEPGARVITGAYARTAFAAGRFRGEFGSEIGSVEVELLP